VTEAYVVDAVRTPMGSYRGALSGVRPDDLAARAIGAIVERTAVDPERIVDVYFGAANQSGEDNRDVARMAALLAGLPNSVPGATVNRLCASGLEAVNSAARAVKAGEGDIYLAGGVESMSRAPWVVEKPERGLPRGSQTMHDTTLGWRMINPRMEELGVSTEAMGETGENVAERYGVTREAQDAFALRSHQRAVAAAERGVFAEEIVPVEAPKGRRETVTIDADEGPRPDASAEKLAALRPVFREGGTVTAGNASTLNDGAACLLIASEAGAGELGAEPLARVVSTGVAGVDPAYMGVGPVPRALAAAGLSLEQIDLIELNEAFASQVLACVKELGIDEERLNVNGGAIALGHPLGCSGARLSTTLVHELRRRGGRYGVATLCVGVGQGLATVFEAV
jgi:3-oxoadipyl-CoA thiolase